MKFWVECLVTCPRVIWDWLWLLEPIIFLKVLKYFWNKYHAIANIDKITTNQGPDGQKIKKRKGKTEGIDHADKKICPDNFFVRTVFFGWTNILSGQKGIYHKIEFFRLTSHMEAGPFLGRQGLCQGGGVSFREARPLSERPGLSQSA